MKKDVKDDLELVTNFNYKAAFCNVELGNYDEAVKHLNKTIDMLNENGRLDKNLEEIYQKCSFEKDRLMYKNNVEDKRFSNFKFLSTKNINNCPYNYYNSLYYLENYWILVILNENDATWENKL